MLAIAPGGLRRTAGPPGDLVPTHVRNLHAWGQIEPGHLAGQDTQPLVMAALRTALEQELQAHADAEKRLVGTDVREDRLHQAAAVERADGVAEGTDPRQHETGGLSHDVRVVGDAGLHANPLQRLLHAAEIAAAIVDDRDHGGEFRAASGRLKVAFVAMGTSAGTPRAGSPNTLRSLGGSATASEMMVGLLRRGA